MGTTTRKRDASDGSFDLRSLNLDNGSAASRTPAVSLDEMTFGGERYVVAIADGTVRLEVSRSASGWFLQLRTAAHIEGPCWRCLGPAVLDSSANVNEFQAHGRAGAEFDEDLDSPYVDGERLDLVTWTIDAVTDQLPPSILCQPNCQGLCTGCGANLNAGPCDCAASRPPPQGLSGIARLLAESGDAP